MTEYLTTTNIKPWMKIGATDANITSIVCDTLQVDGTIILPGGFELKDVEIDNQTNIGDVIITPTTGVPFNLKTPTTGLIGEVLKTDGAGNTYWGVAGGIGSGIVYNGTLPIPNGQHTIISVDGLELTQSVINESATNLDVNGLNITNANDINANQIKNISGNVMYFNTDDSITILNDQSLLTTRTSFTLDQELVTKKYVDDNIPPSSNPTFQDVYDNSDSPAYCNLLYGKRIEFQTEDSSVILAINANTGVDYGITAEKASLNNLNSDISTSNSFIKNGGNDQQYLMADGSTSAKFNQNLNTTDNVSFNKVNVSAAIINNNQLTTKLYVDDAVSATTQDFQSVYDTSSNPAIIEMSGKNINYTRSDNPILTIDGFNYKLTSQDVSVAQITSNNYFPPNSNNQDNWSLSPYIFTATASSFINFSHTPGTSFTYVAAGTTDGWISDNLKYDVNSGLAITATSTLVGGSPVIGEWLQLSTSIAVAIKGFYYGGLSNTLENDIAVDFQLVGSNDGTNFTLLSTQTAQDILYPGKQYIITPTIPYNYFRIIIQSIKPNNLEGRCAVGSGTAFDIIPTNAAKIRILDDAIDIDGSYLTATNFIKQGGTNQQYLMADGSISAKFNQNLNTTDSVSFNSVALTAAITTNTQATTKLYVDNKVGAIAITSTDNNLLGVSGVNPTFSLTPKYTYMITFGGNNNGTTSQWLLPGSVRTSTISNTNVATHQALIPINSTLVWASIQRTTTTGTCSLAYSVNNGAAVPITPILTAGQAQNPAPYPLNVNINAGGNLAISILSSVLSGNTIVSLLLRSN